MSGVFICSATEPFDVLDPCLVVIVVTHDKVAGVLDITVGTSGTLEQ